MTPPNLLSVILSLSIISLERSSFQCLPQTTTTTTKNALARFLEMITPTFPKVSVHCAGQCAVEGVNQFGLIPLYTAANVPGCQASNAIPPPLTHTWMPEYMDVCLLLYKHVMLSPLSLTYLLPH